MAGLSNRATKVRYVKRTIGPRRPFQRHAPGWAPLFELLKINFQYPVISVLDLTVCVSYMTTKRRNYLPFCTPYSAIIAIKLTPTSTIISFG